MIDGPTAAVIVSAVLSLGGAIMVALIKLIPPRLSASHEVINKLHSIEDLCRPMIFDLQTRVAVMESNFGNLGRSFDDLRREIHEMRNELKQITNQHGKSEP
jgi:hypothetical protein